MHGITHLLSHHGSSAQNHEAKASNAEGIRHKKYNADVKLIAELAGLEKTSDEGKLYLNDRQASRGSVSSTYSYGSSYGSSHGSSSSNYGSGNPLHHSNNQSIYHTVHGSGNHSSSGHYHHPLQSLHHTPHLHHYPSLQNHYQQQHQQHLHPHRIFQQHSLPENTSGAVSPTSISPTGEPDRQHHHHHSIQEMIRYFGKRLGHIRRQSECQETPKEKEEEFRNRSQSLDGASKPTILAPDCETTYRIYETILRQAPRRSQSGKRFERGNHQNRNDSWRPTRWTVTKLLFSAIGRHAKLL